MVESGRTTTDGEIWTSPWVGAVGVFLLHDRKQTPIITGEITSHSKRAVLAAKTFLNLSTAFFLSVFCFTIQGGGMALLLVW
jgi:hypothetical protein